MVRDTAVHLMFDYEIEGVRVMEVGCGIGLASLVLNYRNADITSTDYHLEVESFLQENTKLNNGPEIPFILTGRGKIKTASVHLIVL